MLKLLSSLSVVLFFCNLATAQNFSNCKKDDDCILVQSTMCREILAINEKKYSAWEKADMEKKAEKLNADADCKEADDNRLDMKNYNPKCKAKVCTAVYKIQE